MNGNHIYIYNFVLHIMKKVHTVLHFFVFHRRHGGDRSDTTLSRYIVLISAPYPAPFIMAAVAE